MRLFRRNEVARRRTTSLSCIVCCCCLVPRYGDSFTALQPPQLRKHHRLRTWSRRPFSRIKLDFDSLDVELLEVLGVCEQLVTTDQKIDRRSVSTPPKEKSEEDLQFEFTHLGHEIAFPCRIHMIPCDNGRSLVFINGTEASHPPQEKLKGEGIRLVGEMTVNKPAYLKAIEGEGNSHTLYITQFGLTRSGSIMEVDLNPRPPFKAPRYSTPPFRRRPRLIRRMDGPLSWPNEVNRIPREHLTQLWPQSSSPPLHSKPATPAIAELLADTPVRDLVMEDNDMAVSAARASKSSKEVNGKKITLAAERVNGYEQVLEQKANVVNRSGGGVDDVYANGASEVHNGKHVNGAHAVEENVWESAPLDAALLVADGFLMPGKADGGVYIVMTSGADGEGKGETKFMGVSGVKKGWFYHKAVWVNLPGGRKGVLAARATKPLFKVGRGELVLFELPEISHPLSDHALPWREKVLVAGPDVMFHVADLDPLDSTVQVFAAEFFSRRLTMHSICWGDPKLGTETEVVQSWILDDNCGPAYSVTVADMTGAGAPTHLLVTSHECLYDYRSLSDGGSGYDSGGGGGVVTVGDGGGGGALFAYEIPKKWRYYTKVYPSPGWHRTTIASGFRVKGMGVNPGAPGFSYVFHRERNGKGRPYIALAGDCSQAAYILRPCTPIHNIHKKRASSGGELHYELVCSLDLEGTVGSLAISYGELFGGGAKDGFAKLFVPNFDLGKVYIFSFG